MASVKFRSVLSIVLVMGSVAVVNPAMARMSEQQIGTALPVLGTSATGINQQGDIVGTYLDQTGTHGFLLHQGRFTSFDYPLSHLAGSIEITSPSGINRQGDIVGSYAFPPGLLHGFVLRAGHYTSLDDPSVGRTVMSSTEATGITDGGGIVGWSTNARFNTGRGFLWQRGRWTTLNDPKAFTKGVTQPQGINQQGDIVGSYFVSKSATHGFLLRRGRYTTLADPNGRNSTEATGINRHGDVVGQYYGPPDERYRGFLWHQGRYTSLNVPAAGRGGTRASGINGRADIVGTYEDRQGKTHGFVRHQGRYTTIDYRAPGTG